MDAQAPLIRAAVTASLSDAEPLRARFVALAPEGFEEIEADGTLELAAYGRSAERVRAFFPDAAICTVPSGWEERWRDFHRAVEIGPLWVGPPWQQPTAGTLAVVIDPGRAFGTGAHPTTRLCLELLIDETRGSLVDLGCGSGVLAIAAAALGFSPVTGLDSDPVAVEVAAENARQNGAAVSFRLLDVDAEPLPPASVAVANIALEVVEALGPRLRSPRLISSGYRSVDRPETAGYRSIRRLELEGWAADLLICE